VTGWQLLWLTAGIAWFASSGAATLEVHLSNANGQAVEDAAVVLELPVGSPPQHQGRAVIQQQDREFMPYLTIVQTGTAVEFPNRDPFKHHIYSFSPAKTFEIKLYAGKPEKPIIFDKPGKVVLGCNIHDWMEAYVLVVDTPYFAKTGGDGRARLENIPPGQYRMRIWHPRLQSDIVVRDITLAQSPIALSLQANIPPRVSRPKPPLNRDGY
jgi:plastocyanin